jgi:hypothetical protein
MTYGMVPSEKPWINQVVTQLLESSDWVFSPLPKVLNSMPNGLLNHFRVQLDQDGSPFQHDPDCGAFAGRGYNHGAETNKRADLDGNYRPSGHRLFFAKPAYGR